MTICMGSTVEVLTENNSLTYILNTYKLDARQQIWVVALFNYNFYRYFYNLSSEHKDSDTLPIRLDVLREECQFPENL